MLPLTYSQISQKIEKIENKHIHSSINFLKEDIGDKQKSRKAFWALVKSICISKVLQMFENLLLVLLGTLAC